jgi:Rod binding domain-containing protein
MSVNPASAIPAAGPSSGLRTLAASVEPAFVRDGSTALKSAYREALGFEEMLVEQLSKSMSETSGLTESGSEGGGEGEEGGSSMSLLSSMLPQTLAESLTRGGGLGLATQLTTEIDPSALSSEKASS